jgi:hypothetical protein
MSKSERPGDYDVGYAKPPKATQFKKGTSGNPKGRPRKSQSHQAIASRVLNEIRRLGGQPRGAKVRFTVLDVNSGAIVGQWSGGVVLSAPE